MTPLRSAILATVLCAAQAMGQPSSELSGLERRAADRTLSTREREAAADRAIEVRRTLIEAARDTDPALVGLLIDQSAGALARLARDGSDSAALFGIPLPAQRDAAQRAAAEAARHLDRALTVTSSSAKALAAQNLPAEDPRVAAVEQDRTVRIPFYRARALVLLASLSEGEPRRTHAAAAHDAVSKLALATTGPEASRRICIAAALLMRATPPALADGQTALDELAWIARAAAEPGATIPGLAQAEAWLAIAHAGAVAGRVEQSLEGLRLASAKEPFVQGGRPDPLFIVLAADATTRALWERAIREKSAELFTRAAAAQTALLTRDDLGLRAETLRPLVLEKLAILASATDPALPLPPIARLGRAIALARDPSKAGAAAGEFRALADAAEAGDFAADALWEWAVLLTQSPQAPAADRLNAAAALVRLARDFPAHPRAADAMHAALAHARALAVGDAPRDEAARIRTVYAEALAVATESYPRLSGIDLWRYERARLLADSASPSADDLATALSMLDEVPATSTVAADASRLHDRVQTAAIADDFKRIAALRVESREDAIRALARDRTVPEARRAVEWARARQPAAAPRFRLDLADAMVEAGDKSAATIYQELIPVEAKLPGGQARVRLGLGRAFLMAQDSAKAFVHLREVVAKLDAPPAAATEPPRPDCFWHAWTLMLETLHAEDPAGQRRGSIRANIKRLEATDPELGGAPWKTRISRIRDAVGS